MSEIERDEFGRESSEKRRARRRVFWLGVAGASVLAAVTSVVAIAGTSEARAMRGFFGHAHGGHGFHDAEAAREHAEIAARSLLRSVEASDAQQAQVQAIVGESVAALLPLAEQHRAHREVLLTLLAQETIDRAALEDLRAQEFALADAASRALVAALADVAEALTPEQRAELLAHATRFHR